MALNGEVIHGPTSRHIAYGELVAEAAKLSPPANPPLKSPADFRLIGKAGVKRTDAKAKSNGNAVYGGDLRLPGMVTAVVARPPVFGAKLKAFNRAAVLRLPGIVAVLPIPSGVAVVDR